MGFGTFYFTDASRNSRCHRCIGWWTKSGILAVQILAAGNEDLLKKVIEFKENLKNKILKANKELSEIKLNIRPINC